MLMKQSVLKKHNRSGSLNPGDPIVSDRDIDKLKLQGLFDQPINTEEASSLESINKVLKKKQRFHDRFNKYRSSLGHSSSLNRISNSDNEHSMSLHDTPQKAIHSYRRNANNDEIHDL